ncbi:esterase-like activity of phytase family protein [Erythrobacter sp. JK5]|uniref:esterase-like activity of phytase family protein n=1 Tax=Erythrobacter sp. JK5 TaxID=2829500 RepID=UPI001BAD9243|nr:esterase-like activity of phytase family protein [Erythrobacter sp. JK5]QUL36621.1 esterase-like activity of phytase family protein [Erythrobacter sp. JK5]
MLIRGRGLWIGGAILLAVAALLAAWLIVHRPHASDSPDIVLVPLSEDDPSLVRVGELRYLGGIDLPRLGQNIGGLSGLRWDAGTLLALTDDARWVRIAVRERDSRLVGVGEITTGSLLGFEGEPLTGKEAGDSEALTRSADGGWLVAFERDHRVWRYPALGERPEPTAVDPVALFGALEANRGIETLAGDETGLFACAERWSGPDDLGNCIRQVAGADPERVVVSPQGPLYELGGTPTDADFASDGTLYLLFRSYSPGDGNGAEIVALNPRDERRALATLRPPLTVDNFEGLAVREEGGRTFLYLVSDDNFSGSQRTLLLKFAVVPPRQPARE